MAILNKLCSLLLMLLLLCGAAFAKEKKNDVIVSVSEDAVEDENGIIPAEETWQFLEWIDDYPQYVLRYEVVIEQFDKKTKSYKEALTLETESNETRIRIVPNLKPGNYRFKVCAYNLIGLKEEYSEWCDFSIYIAYKPRVSSVSVNVNHSNTFYLEELNDGIFTVKGNNLFELQSDPDEITFSSYALVSQSGGRRYVPEIVSHDDNNKEIVFRIDLDLVEVGKYNLISTASCGLQNDADSDSLLVLRYKKPIDFDVSGGYTFPIVMFDDTIETYFNSKMFPLSVMGKMTFIPLKKRIGYFGIGLEAYYTRMSGEERTYSIDGNLVSGYLNFVYQFPIRLKPNEKGVRKQIMTLELHGGAGVEYFMNYMFHFSHDIDSEPLNSMNLSFDAGGAVSVFLTNRLYIEANVDFCITLISDMSMGVLRPSVLVGWQF